MAFSLAPIQEAMSLNVATTTIFLAWGASFTVAQENK